MGPFLLAVNPNLLTFRRVKNRPAADFRCLDNPVDDTLAVGLWFAVAGERRRPDGAVVQALQIRMASHPQQPLFHPDSLAGLVEEDDERAAFQPDRLAVVHYRHVISRWLR